jgi:SulP family sulfate permease
VQNPLGALRGFCALSRKSKPVLDRIGQLPRVLVLDFAEVPIVDSTAAKALEKFAERLTSAGSSVFLTGAAPAVRRSLVRAGLRKPLVRYAKSIEQAKDFARSRMEGGAEVA